MLCRLAQVQEATSPPHLQARGKVYSTCVRSAMLHGGETWGPNAPELQRLRRNNLAMIRWICGTKDRDEIPSYQLRLKLDIGDIVTVLRNRRLRWAGHVRRATSCIRRVADREFLAAENEDGLRRPGRIVLQRIWLIVACPALTRWIGTHGERE